MAQLTESHLHPWQRHAVAEGSNRRFGICARVGSGKTAVAATIAKNWLDQDPHLRVLVVAPRPVLDSTWAKEFSKWEHLDHLTIDLAHSYDPEIRSQLWSRGTSNFTTCTPDLLASFLAVVANDPNHKIGGIVVDEAHLFKNPTSKRSLALQASTRNSSPRVLLVSGTPNPNGLEDLWVPGIILSRGDAFWGRSFDHFQRTRFNQVTDYTWRPKPGQSEEITAAFKKHSIAVGNDRELGVPLPTYRETPFSHDQSHVARMNLFSMERRMVIDGVIYDGESDGAYLAKFHQLTQGFVYQNEVPQILSWSRVDALEEIARSVSTPVLVGVKFKADVEMIQNRFPHAKVFNGDTPNAERMRLIEEWNAGKISMLLASPQAAGVGLNLQFGPCGDLVWYSHPWDSALQVQFEGRLVRQGQTRNIRIHQLVSSVGLDSALLSTLARKQSGADALMNAIRL
jgi:SNF2 family DNA or RNA helicase